MTKNSMSNSDIDDILLQFIDDEVCKPDSHNHDDFKCYYFTDTNNLNKAGRRLSSMGVNNFYYHSEVNMNGTFGQLYLFSDKMIAMIENLIQNCRYTDISDYGFVFFKYRGKNIFSIDTKSNDFYISEYLINLIACEFKMAQTSSAYFCEFYLNSKSDIGRQHKIGFMCDAEIKSYE